LTQAGERYMPIEEYEPPSNGMGVFRQAAIEPSTAHPSEWTCLRCFGGSRITRRPVRTGIVVSASSYASDNVDWILEKIVLTPGMTV
jgi:hypothetical protein